MLSNPNGLLFLTLAVMCVAARSEVALSKGERIAATEAAPTPTDDGESNLRAKLPPSITKPLCVSILYVFFTKIYWNTLGNFMLVHV